MIEECRSSWDRALRRTLIVSLLAGLGSLGNVSAGSDVAVCASWEAGNGLLAGALWRELRSATTGSDFRVASTGVRSPRLVPIAVAGWTAYGTRFLERAPGVVEPLRDCLVDPACGPTAVPKASQNLPSVPPFGWGAWARKELGCPADPEVVARTPEAFERLFPPSATSHRNPSSPPPFFADPSPDSSFDRQADLPEGPGMAAIGVDPDSPDPGLAPDPRPSVPVASASEPARPPLEARARQLAARSRDPKWTPNVLAPDPKSNRKNFPDDLRRRMHRIEKIPLQPDPIAISELDSSAVSPGPAPSSGRTVSVDLAAVRRSLLRYHLDLQVEALRSPAARENVRSAEARFDPTIFAVVSRTQSDNRSLLRHLVRRTEQKAVGATIPMATGGTLTVSIPFDDDNANTTGFNAGLVTLDNRTYTVSFSQPLLRNGGRFVNNSGIYAARLLSGQVDARTKLVVNSLLAAGERAYWRHWAAGREVDIARRQYELAKGIYKQVQKLANGGLVAEVETIRARSGVTRRVGVVFQAETARRQTEYELLRIMNRPDLKIGAGIAVLPQDDPELNQFEVDPEALIQVGLRHRMDLLDAQLQVAADEVSARVARNQVRPGLNFDVSLSQGDVQTGNGNLSLKDKSDIWSAQLSFEVPLGNRAARAIRRQAALQKLLSLRTVEQRRLQVRTDVYSAVAALELSWKLILAARQDTRSATAIFAAETRQFELGERTTTEVLETAQFLANAQVSEARSMRDYELARTDLAFAAGVSVGYDGLRVAAEPRGVAHLGKP